MQVSTGAVKRRLQKSPPEEVGGFLKSLQQQGLSKKQIGNLARKQDSPKAWNRTYKNITARNQARGAAFAFGGIKGPKGRRGNPNYKDTTPETDIADTFSRNNPKSLPNRAANAAESAVKGTVRGANKLFTGGKGEPVGAVGHFKQEAIKRRLRNKK